MYANVVPKTQVKGRMFRFARRLSRTVRSVLAAKMVLKYLGYGALAAFIWKYIGFTLFHSVASSFIVYLLAGGWKYWRIVVKTFPRDIR